MGDHEWRRERRVSSERRFRGSPANFAALRCGSRVLRDGAGSVATSGSFWTFWQPRVMKLLNYAAHANYRYLPFCRFALLSAKRSRWLPKMHRLWPVENVPGVGGDLTARTANRDESSTGEVLGVRARCPGGRRMIDLERHCKGGSLSRSARVTLVALTAAAPLQPFAHSRRKGWGPEYYRSALWPGPSGHQSSSFSCRRGGW